MVEFTKSLLGTSQSFYTVRTNEYEITTVHKQLSLKRRKWRLRRAWSQSVSSGSDGRRLQIEGLDPDGAVRFHGTWGFIRMVMGVNRLPFMHALINQHNTTAGLKSVGAVNLHY